MQADSDDHPGATSAAQNTSTATSASRRPIHGVLLDMDGVLYHDDAPLPGAADLLRRIAGISTA